MPNEFEERLRWHVGDKVNTLGVARSALDELLETIIFEIVREREITYRSFDEAADAVLADPYMCRAAGERFLTEVLGATDPGALIPSRRPIRTRGAAPLRAPKALA